MASLETPAGRAAALAAGRLGGIPRPDGTIDLSDRAHVLGVKLPASLYVPPPLTLDDVQRASSVTVGESYDLVTVA